MTRVVPLRARGIFRDSFYIKWWSPWGRGGGETSQRCRSLCRRSLPWTGNWCQAHLRQPGWEANVSFPTFSSSKDNPFLPWRVLVGRRTGRGCLRKQSLESQPSARCSLPLKSNVFIDPRKCFWWFYQKDNNSVHESSIARFVGDHYSYPESPSLSHRGSSRRSPWSPRTSSTALSADQGHLCLPYWLSIISELVKPSNTCYSTILETSLIICNCVCSVRTDSVWLNMAIYRNRDKHH